MGVHAGATTVYAAGMQTERTTRRTTDVPRDVPPADHVVRLTVAQAADRLGITRGAVRSRIKRGTLPTTKEAGRVYVVLGGGTSQANYTPDTDEPTGEPSAQRADPLVEELREQVAYLRQELTAEREAGRRKDHLLAAALERIPPAIDPPRDAPHAREEAGGEADEVEPRPPAGEAQEGSERRPWWRRWFGFE